MQRHAVGPYPERGFRRPSPSDVCHVNVGGGLIRVVPVLPDDDVPRYRRPDLVTGLRADRPDPMCTATSRTRIPFLSAVETSMISVPVRTPKIAMYEEPSQRMLRVTLV